MKKWFILAIVVVGTGLAATGIGTSLIQQVDDNLKFRSVESRIDDALVDLRQKKRDARTKLFELRSKESFEETARARDQKERDRLDQACQRMTAKLNTAIERRDGLASRAVFIAWGTNDVDVETAKNLIVRWGKRVDELSTKIHAHRRKEEAYRNARLALEKTIDQYGSSVVALETRLKELLARRDVLRVQRDVAEITASASGAEVPGRVAELLGELQGENDALDGEIAAYSMTSVDDALIGPDDDLTAESTRDILARYGVKSIAADGVVISPGDDLEAQPVKASFRGETAGDAAGVESSSDDL